jgi:transcriptional regulator GlxA family with amidase domain
VVFDASLVEAACRGVRAGRLRRCQLEAADPRGAAFHRLHAAIDRGAEPFALEVAAAEALAALATELTGDPPPAPARPVQRAIEMLRDRLAEPITLDAVAEHAGLDKFHLSRAFRDQVGLPPHAYRTHLRVHRAKQLLAAGVRPGIVAVSVGFYDQSQLHRHFRRLVGTTPGEYWRASRRR